MGAASFTLGPALLFCPADRPDRYAKARDRADAVILDLEDALTPVQRPAGREALKTHPIDPARTIVRINPLGTADHEADLAALAETDYTTVMLPKAEASTAAALADGTSAPALRRPDGTDYAVIALCETAAGVLAAPELARQPQVVALAWGAEDLIVSLGGTASRNDAGAYRDVARYARSAVLLAARAAGKAAIDAVHLDIGDLDGARAEAADAAAVGFCATLCIHPSQVAPVRAAFTPSPEVIDLAREVLEAARHAAEQGVGVLSVRGRMVDAPMLEHAESVLRRAQEPGESTAEGAPS